MSSVLLYSVNIHKSLENDMSFIKLPVLGTNLPILGYFRKPGFLRGRIAFSFLAMSFLAACPAPDPDAQQVNIRDTIKVALLVPKGSGNPGLDAIGNSLENAAKMALKEENDGEIALSVYSTGADPKRAASAAMKAKEAGASLIIGPLTSLEANAAAAAAGLPMITFSNNAEIAGKNVYVLGTAFDVVAERVVEYASGRGATKIGIIATDDVGGKQGADATRRAAERSGMQVVTNGKYALSLSSINENAPKIINSLKSAGADSVMFTDTPSGGLGFITEKMKSSGFSSGSARYLGLSQWGSDKQLLASGRLNGGYFAIPDPAARSNFEKRYKAQTGSDAHDLAGLGHDAVSLAIALVRRARMWFDSTPFDEAAIRSRNIDGALGRFRFNEDNLAERSLAVMQVQNGKAVMVSAAQN